MRCANEDGGQLTSQFLERYHGQNPRIGTEHRNERYAVVASAKASSYLLAMRCT
jgi:hypothetical protein